MQSIREPLPIGPGVVWWKCGLWLSFSIVSDSNSKQLHIRTTCIVDSIFHPMRVQTWFIKALISTHLIIYIFRKMKTRQWLASFSSWAFRFRDWRNLPLLISRPPLLGRLRHFTTYRQCQVRSASAMKDQSWVRRKLMDVDVGASTWMSCSSMRIREAYVWSRIPRAAA